MNYRELFSEDVEVIKILDILEKEYPTEDGTVEETCDVEDYYVCQNEESNEEEKDLHSEREDQQEFQDYYYPWKPLNFE